VLKHQVNRFRTILLSAASSPCPDLNLIHYNGHFYRIV